MDSTSINCPRVVLKAMEETISKFEASSGEVEKLLRLKKSIEAQESERIEAAYHIQ